MARPREFDREQALEHAMRVFWAKGFAATSTEDLVQAMGIGRQSLYNAFGDKRQLYLEALDAYQRGTVTAHLERLAAPASVSVGLTDLLLGLIPHNDEERALGCMGVGAACEFGATDPELVELRAHSAARLRKRLRARIREGQANGEIDAEVDAALAADFIQMTMTGIQLAARSGASAEDLRAMARFAANRLKTR